MFVDWLQQDFEQFRRVFELRGRQFLGSAVVQGFSGFKVWGWGMLGKRLWGKSLVLHAVGMICYE